MSWRASDSGAAGVAQYVITGAAIAATLWIAEGVRRAIVRAARPQLPRAAIR